MNKSVSFLLGAGFSAPAGYPIGNKLGDRLLGSLDEKLVFHTDGSLIPPKNGNKVNLGFKNYYDGVFELCCDLMNLFKQKKSIDGFDYEEFFDYFNEKDSIVRKDIASLLNEKKYPRIENTEYDINQALFNMGKVYNELISYYLVDRNKLSWYNESPSYEEYSSFISLLNFLKNENTINVHTLNHDVFFEYLIKANSLESDFSDGFVIENSPFYGVNNHRESVNIEYYIGTYGTGVNLFKLHGSRDYRLFYSSEGTNDEVLVPSQYVKFRYGLADEIIKRTVDVNDEVTEERFPFSYHGDFLSGINSKIKRYNEPILYGNLFRYFSENLKEAQALCIIGYGGRDSKVNEIILENFDYKNKRVIVVDPYPSDYVRDFVNNLQGELIEVGIEGIDVNSFKF
ncbi:hypothetical protein V6R21_19905 [Limibacter armeniacum]|uniref:hypothetical protein n=1 Tax=Limibacter armeniacum TaxID=466084 RepID=UPI002FE515D0